MAETTPKVITPTKIQASPGNWVIPGARGIEGTPNGIAAPIEAAGMPDTALSALKALIADALKDSDANFVSVHGNGSRRDDENGRHDIITFSIETSKKNLG